RIVVAPSDQALDGEDGLFRIGDRLPFGRLADQPLTVVRERDDRWGGAHAFCVFDDFRRLAFHHGDAGIGGSEVDTDDLSHDLSSSSAAGRPGPYGTRGFRFDWRTPASDPLKHKLDAARA